MKAYWWKGPEYPNLGDELTRIILERLFGRNVKHSTLAETDLAAVGSLLGWIWENPNVRSRKRPLHIVGAGFMSSDTEVSELPFLRVHSVRGYLSKNKLGSLDSWKVAVGDPGLLAPRVLESIPSKRTAGGKYGVILHHRHSFNDEIKDRFKHLPVEFLDIRTANLEDFMNDLSACEVVVSQSLHGLILADALGIPNAWLTLGPIHSGGHFKFYDYFSSVGRPFYLQIAGVPKTKAAMDKMVWTPDSKRIESVADRVARCFEDAMNDLDTAALK